ncbi:hypothetical protein Scep_014835 [Stephania cephalantha]|uniref:Uncharacterized protein n=1 Tax=Stephania cephalantha TaxID=152367 RepID=A0AAP0J206_9MAGN
MGKYIPPTVCNLKRTDSQTIRQGTGESVMHGLLDSIGSGVVTTDRAHYRRPITHASEYWSHHRYRHIQCEGLEMIIEKRGIDGRGKEINLKAYCVSTICGVYGASVRRSDADILVHITAATTSDP